MSGLLIDSLDGIMENEETKNALCDYIKWEHIKGVRKITIEMNEDEIIRVTGYNASGSYGSVKTSLKL